MQHDSNSSSSNSVSNVGDDSGRWSAPERDIVEELHRKQIDDAEVHKAMDGFYRRNVHDTHVLTAFLHHLIFCADDDDGDDDDAGMQMMTQPPLSSSSSSSSLSRSRHDAVTARSTALAAEAHAITEYVLGKRDAWHGNSAAARVFRHRMARAYERELAIFCEAYPDVSVAQATRNVPQTYLLPALSPTQWQALTQAWRRVDPARTAADADAACDDTAASSAACTSIVLQLQVWYVDLTDRLCATTHACAASTLADTAIATVAARVLRVAAFAAGDAARDAVFVFRVRECNDYIYGDAPLINFRYVRTCVRTRAVVQLCIEAMPEQLLTLPRFRPSYRLPLPCNPTHDTLHTRRCRDGLARTRRSAWDAVEPLTLHVTSSDAAMHALALHRLRDDGAARDVEAVYVAVLVEVYFGTARCGAARRTSWRLCRPAAARRDEDDDDAVRSRTTTADDAVDDAVRATVCLDVSLSRLPRESRLCFTVCAVPCEHVELARRLTPGQLAAVVDDVARTSGEQSKQTTTSSSSSPSPTSSGGGGGGAIVVIGAATMQLYDVDAVLRTDVVEVAVWRSRVRAHHVAFCASCPPSHAAATPPPLLRVQLPLYHGTTVVYPSGRPPASLEREATERSLARQQQHLPGALRDDVLAQLRQLRRICAYDPLVRLSEVDKLLVWLHRDVLVHCPTMLCKFLCAVDWLQPYEVYVTHCLVQRWRPLSVMDALELLDMRFADTVARAQALVYLQRATDHELRQCLVQLVQVLKYEPYHYSALARFLLARALRSNHMIGHYLFWHLVAEVQQPSMCERYGLLLEELLLRCPLRRGYLRQVYLVRELVRCALHVQRAAKKERGAALQQSLATLRFPRRVTSPLHAAMEYAALDLAACKVMDSKKFPLWLAFRNYHASDVSLLAIFKSGDDLRQDVLTLQLLELMDSVWRSHGLDLRMTTYRCIATGADVGMIEVVLDSDTIANITRRDGGAQAAFRAEPLLNWLRMHNTERWQVERCVMNFIYSVAGYTVASYVLGIGDRHNDNIMLRRDGTLFHIDFGHFLGNFKTKFGFRRETAPFIFTPMYLHVMGGSVNSPFYRFFVDVACRAYNLIRRHGEVFMMLFTLMLSTGIAELQSKEDVEWLRSVLLLDRSDDDAAEHYKSLIGDALTNKRVLINDYIHIMAH